MSRYMILFAFLVTFSFGSDYPLHEMFFDDVEVITTRVEPEDRHLVAPVVDFGLARWGHQIEVFRDEHLRTCRGYLSLAALALPQTCGKALSGLVHRGV